MDTLVSSFYIVDGGRLEVVHHPEDIKPFFVVVYPFPASSECHELLYFRHKDEAVRFCISFVSAYNSLINT